MKITINNYDEIAAKIDWGKMPEPVAQTHKRLMPIASKNNWSQYNTSPQIHETVDLFFKRIESLMAPQPANKTEKKAAEKQPSKPQSIPASKPAKAAKNLPAESIKEKATRPKKEKVVYDTKEVEHIENDVSFIRRYANMHGKTKTADQILRLLKGLQKAMVEKRITKQSPYAKEIMGMQESLATCYERMNGAGTIELTITATKLKRYLAIANSEQKMLSVALLTAYISLHGAKDARDKARKLLDRINTAIENGAVTKADKYFKPLNAALQNLQQFITDHKSMLSVQQAELNGLAGIPGAETVQAVPDRKNHKIDLYDLWEARRAVPQESFSGFGNAEETKVIPLPMPASPSVRVMNSMDFTRLKFKTLGFKGKWKAFIGDPAPGFKAMISGKPKLGKSTLAIEFAGYLARNHGRVLYVAKEEGLDKTLQDKLNRPEVKHPNLEVADGIPDNSILARADFIFLDSVTKLGLTPEALSNLEASLPGKSFIDILQTTKDGVFRGSDAFQHNVDVVIEVPERGKAIQFGRFNQGGEMDISFPQAA